MFTVPEVDDDTESAPPADAAPPEPAVDKPDDDAPAATAATPPTTGKQHVSRLSHFNRNATHGADQINDRV